MPQQNCSRAYSIPSNLTASSRSATAPIVAQFTSLASSVPQNGISPTIFWSFVGSVVGFAALLCGVLLWRLHRRKARRSVRIENAVRARNLDSFGISTLPELPESPISQAGVPLSPFSDSGVNNPSRGAMLSSPNTRRPLEPRIEPPGAAHRSSLGKLHRANLRRFAALREAKLKEEMAQRVADGSEPDDEDDEGEDDMKTKKGDTTAKDPTALEDTVSRSDDSVFDIHHRGPPVNPAYQAARNKRYREKIAQGYTHEQAMAMSVSDASTESDRAWPHAVPEGLRSNPVSVAFRTVPLSSSSGTPPGTRVGAQHLTATAGAAVAIQLAPLQIPERWLPRVPGEGSVSSDVDAADDEGPRILREPDPAYVGNGRWSRLSQVDMAGTEHETATREDTVISDDPWRDEVEHNKRRGG